MLRKVQLQKIEKKDSKILRVRSRIGYSNTSILREREREREPLRWAVICYRKFWDRGAKQSGVKRFQVRKYISSNLCCKCGNRVRIRKKKVCLTCAWPANCACMRVCVVLSIHFSGSG